MRSIKRSPTGVDWSGVGLNFGTEDAFDYAGRFARGVKGGVRDEGDEES